MKKTLFLVLVMVLSSVLGSNSFAADRAHTLKVYNWADYVSMDVLDEFPAWYYEQTGEQVEVLLQTFDINEAMLAEIEVGHEDYDVICPSEYIIERMLRNQLLQPINKDFGSTPDYTTSVSSFAVEKFQQMAPDSTTSVADYAVGYMWGTTGFIYNPSLVSKSEILSIGCLNDEKFRGKILMKDAFRDIYSLFVLYVYQDEINRGEVTRDELVANVTEERIQRVEEFILSMKDNIAGWEVDFGKEEMIKGRAWINVSWSGDANWAIDEAAQVGVTLDYILPKEGSSVWFDGWCIPIYAKNTKAASYFINYMCMPQNAIRNMEEVGYVSVISSPEVLAWANDENIHETVDLTYFFGKDAEAVHANKVLYPDQSVIEYCSLMHDCGDMTEPMLAMWSRVKGDNLSIGMLIFIVIVLVMSVIFCVLKVLSKKKQKRVYSKKNSNKKNTTTKMLLTIGLSWISIAAFPNAASAEEYENNIGISIEAGADIVSSYLWRGQNLGGLSIQPSVTFDWKGLYLSGWGNIGADNWTFEYFNPELDITIGYDDYGVQVDLTHLYYFGGDSYFGKGGFNAEEQVTGSTMEAHFGFHLGDLVEKIPLSLDWYTTIYGDDCYQDKNGEWKRAWSTYIEVGYDFNLPLGMTLGAHVGIVPWLSSYTDYKEVWKSAKTVAINNINLRLERNFQIKDLYLGIWGEMMLNCYGVSKNNLTTTLNNKFDQHFNWRIGASLYIGKEW